MSLGGISGEKKDNNYRPSKCEKYAGGQFEQNLCFGMDGQNKNKKQK